MSKPEEFPTETGGEVGKRASNRTDIPCGAFLHRGGVVRTNRPSHKAQEPNMLALRSRSRIPGAARTRSRFQPTKLRLPAQPINPAPHIPPALHARRVRDATRLCARRIPRGIRDRPRKETLRRAHDCLDGDVELVRGRRHDDPPGRLLDGERDFRDGGVVRKRWGVERERLLRELGRM